jgi:hypothetical protein
MIERDHILSEIRRTAEDNGGRPLGRERFQAATGIREADWSGRYWVRWNDAVREAGYEPNTLNQPFSDDHILGKLAEFVQELDHFPTMPEMAMKARRDSSFPNEKTFRRFGRKHDLAARLQEFCASRGSFADVATVCSSVTAKSAPADAPSDSPVFGYVYLIKAGRYYKIGRSNSVERRHRELAIQLPERATVIHTISTDDPVGIEAYWHRRFENLRLNGEWFDLSQSDLAAFRRRKFM